VLPLRNLPDLIHGDMSTLRNNNTLTTTRKPISRWLLLLTLLLTGLLLFLAFHNVAWDDMLTTARRAQGSFLLLAAAVYGVTYLLRGLRWHLLLSADSVVPRLTAISASNVGYLGNSLLPARAGELIRVVLIGKSSAVSASYALATVVTERVSDAGILILLSLVALQTVKNIPEWLTAASRITALLVVVGVVVFLVIFHYEARIMQLLDRLPLAGHVRARLGLRIQQFLQGARALQNLERMLGYAVLTALIWLLDILFAIFIADSFQLHLALPEAILLLTALGLSSAVPSTPGYVGVFQFVAVTVLVPFGFMKSEALVYILTYQLVTYIVTIILGLLGLLQIQIKLRSIPAASGTLL